MAWQPGRVPDSWLSGCEIFIGRKISHNTVKCVSCQYLALGSVERVIHEYRCRQYVYMITKT
jgi:hypothetical protein